jgi:molybdopterin converting factor small subunit
MLPTASIRIPNVLRHHTGGARAVTVSASTVGEALEVLFEQHSSLRDSLIPKSGDIFEAVNLFLNDTDIGSADRLDTQVNDGDSITILPAMAGG